MIKKIKILLILFLSILLLFSFPQPTKAFIGTGIFDYFETALEGVEEKAGPVAAKIVLIFFTAFIGLILLFTSATLLQWIITNPEWLTLKNPVVESGLYFTIGLVNLFIILFFVAIAIAWILKIETFAVKKALPKLILVALLVNFVRIFVGVPIDIAVVLHKTILNAAGTDFFWNAIAAIYGGLENMLLGIAAWIMSLTALFMIPFVSPFIQYGLVAFVVGMFVLFGPVLLSWIVQIVLAYLLSMIFFTLAFLFACRIYVIWFLTIVAPLAFLCMVLPQTEKYWKEWLQHLLDWAFFGIIVLLFLVIGLRGAQHLRPGGTEPTLPGVYWFSLPAYFGYYFFLFVYISIVSWLSKRMAPQMASFLITQATAFGGYLRKAGGPVAKATYETAKETWRRSERAKGWAAAQIKAPRPTTRMGKLRAAIARPVAGWVWRTTEEAEISELEREKSKAAKLVTPEAKLAAIRTARTRAAKVGALQAVIAAKQTRDLEKLGFRRREITEIGKAALEVHPEAFKPIRDAYPNLAERMGRGLPWDLRKKAGVVLTSEDRAKGYTSVTEKLIVEVRPEKLETITRAAALDPDVIRGLMRATGTHLGVVARAIGMDFVDEFMKAADAKGRQWFEHVNPPLLRYLRSTGAQRVGLREPLPRRPPPPPSPPPPPPSPPPPPPSPPPFKPKIKVKI